MGFKKLYLGFFAIVSVAVASIVYNIVAMQQNKGRILEITDEVYPYIEQLEYFRQLAGKSKSLTTSWVYLKYATTDKEELKNIHQEVYPKLKNTIQGSFESLHLKQDQKKLDELFASFEDLLSVQQDIMELLPNNDAYEDPLALFEGEDLIESLVVPQSAEIESILNRLIAINKQKAEENKEVMLESIENFGYVTVSMGVIITLLIIFSFIYIKNEITNPVILMNQQVDELSRGKIANTQAIQDRSTVVGEMSRALQKLSQSLERTAAFASAVGAGNYEASYTKLSEEDMLGNALIQMRDELSAYARRMEEKIKQRTAEIASVNAELRVSEEELRQNADELRAMNDNLQSTNEQLASTIEELRETQAQLVQAEKMSSLGELTAGIAHEINNPINFVFAGINSLQALVDDSLELLNEYSALSEQQSYEELKESLKRLEKRKEEVIMEELEEDIKGLVQDITLGAERTQTIVKGLQTFSRMGGDGEVRVDLHENLDATLTIVGNKVHENIEIIKEYDPELPNINCNIGRINQVFMNVITNAIQATEKGNITIRTEKVDNSRVAISISDTGAGIDQEVLDKIFNPFFTTKDVGEGTGLGLSISFGIIEQHGGSIDVQSKKGQGTTFRIELPTGIADADASAN